MQDRVEESVGSVPLSDNVVLLRISVCSPCILRSVCGVIIFNRGICMETVFKHLEANLAIVLGG